MTCIPKCFYKKECTTLLLIVMLMKIRGSVLDAYLADFLNKHNFFKKVRVNDAYWKSEKVEWNR